MSQSWSGLLLDAEVFHAFKLGQIEARNRGLERGKVDTVALGADDESAAEHDGEFIAAIGAFGALFVDQAAVFVLGAFESVVVQASQLWGKLPSSSAAFPDPSAPPARRKAQ